MQTNILILDFLILAELMYLLVCLCLPGSLTGAPAWSRLVFHIYGGLTGSQLEEGEVETGF